MPTILVVDDDPTVLKYVCSALGQQNHHIMSALNARSAIAICAGTEEIDLVITDVQMPGMNGRELAKYLEKNFPSLAIMFITGYVTDSAFECFRTGEPLLDGRRLLQKPFKPDALTAIVNELVHP